MRRWASAELLPDEPEPVYRVWDRAELDQHLNAEKHLKRGRIKRHVIRDPHTGKFQPDDPLKEAAG